MEIYHWNEGTSNFGDEINTWLWSDLAGQNWPCRPETLFVGIGTVLDQQIPKTSNVCIFGSGAGYGAPSNLTALGWRVFGVRGPITARLCGLTDEAVIGDPAILLPDVFPVPRQQRSNPRKIVYVPHVHSVANAPWKRICHDAGVQLVDPRDESKSVIREIALADLVLAEAMHAAIIADSYRVPWIPVWTSLGVNALKWFDWASSLNMTITPHRLAAPSLLMAADNLASSIAGFDRTSPFFNWRTRKFYDLEEMISAQKRLSSFRSLKKTIGLNYLRLRNQLSSAAVTRLTRQQQHRLSRRTASQLESLAGQIGQLSNERSLNQQKQRQRSEFKAFLSEFS